jgi:hypothetical protein
MSPNIDQNSSPKERAKKKQGKYLLTLRKYEANFLVNHNIATTAINGLLVKTASKSQQDKTIIMK